MVQDFLASGITQLISSLASGNGFDFGGFLSGSGGSGGGSSLGGILGSLLGGGGGSGGSGGGLTIPGIGGGGLTIPGIGGNGGILGSLLGGGGAGSAGGIGSLFSASGPIGSLFSASGPIGGLFASGGFFGAGGAVASAFSGLASAILPALGPLGIAVGAFVLLDSLFGGGRSPTEVLRDEQRDLLGQNVAGEALGANGEVGFNGGNTGIFGANFGVTGTGLTSQLIQQGENGLAAFFNGAQQNLEEFQALAEQSGFETILDDGALRLLSDTATTEQVIALWQAYRDGLTEAVAHSAVFRTAIENDLIQPSNLFFEQFALGFGQSAFEARDSLLLIDQRFDELTANGVASTEALFTSISEHYGIAVEDAQLFVERSGVSIEQWRMNFENASGQALNELLDFNAEGRTAFETTFAQITDTTNTTFSGIGEGAAALTLGIGQDFIGLTGTISEQGMAAANAFRNGLSTLNGAANSINLGTPQINSPSVDLSNVNTTNSLGNFNSALTGSETVNVTGPSFDTARTIGVNSRESVTINRKGMIERIETKLDTLVQGNNGSDETVMVMRQLISEIVEERRGRRNAFG